MLRSEEEVDKALDKLLVTLESAQMHIAELEKTNYRINIQIKDLQFNVRRCMDWL